MLEPADYDGDVDRAIEVLLLAPCIDFPAIIERLKRAHRDREAMAYLDRAVDQFRSTLNEPTTRYHQIARLGVDAQSAVDLYCEDGREDEAMELARTLFDASPTPSSYDFLLSVAKRLDCVESEHLRAIARAEAFHGTSGGPMVLLALHEKDIERTWAYANRWQAGITWQILTDFTPQPRPIDALELYEDAVHEVLIMAGRGAAKQAVGLLKRMEAIAPAAGTSGEQRVSEFVASLRQTYKNRPTLKEALDQAGF